MNKVYEGQKERKRRGIKMEKDKKFVQEITDMNEDFAQWYTDVVKRLSLLNIQVSEDV